MIGSSGAVRSCDVSGGLREGSVGFRCIGYSGPCGLV